MIASDKEREDETNKNNIFILFVYLLVYFVILPLECGLREGKDFCLSKSPFCPQNLYQSLAHVLNKD